MSYKKFGIDISKYQKGIDFSKLAADGVEFIILRCAYHLGKDTQFEDFYKKAKAKKIPVGVYLYTTAKSVNEAQAEAEFLIKDVLKGKQLELPVYYDIEEDFYYSRPKKQNSELVKAFCDTMEKNGYFAGVYASKNFFDTYLDDSMLTNYAHWVAQWSKSCTYKNKEILGMWQFGGETNAIRSNKVAGYVCDQNYMYEDYPKIIKDNSLNGYGTVKTAQPKFTGTFKKGDTGIGVYLLKQNLMLLKDAGIITQAVNDDDIFGDGTQTAVKQLQKAAGIGQDGVAGAKTIPAIRKLLKTKIL